MPHHHITAMGLVALKRSLDGPEPPKSPDYSLSPLAGGLIILVTILFIPAFLITSYTFKSVYTTLAIVENPSPAAYEAVASDDNDAAPAAVPGAGGAAAGEPAAEIAGRSKPVTASFRRTYKLLKAAGGRRGNYRGLLLAIFISVLSTVGTLVVAAIPFVPAVVAGLVVSLALVQVQAAWVHTIIRANPSSTSIFRGGLPPFRRAFEATSVPTFLLWLATSGTALVDVLVARALKLDSYYRLHNPVTVPAYTNDLVWKTLVVVLVSAVLVLVLTIPANVVLVRTQASLLPPDEDTVVPFDRSFSGTVEPAVVGSRAFVTIRDALRTVSRASWKRIYIVYIKQQVTSLFVNTAYAAIIMAIVLSLGSKAEEPSF